MRNPQKLYLSFILVFILAILVRFSHLGLVPGSLYWDEIAILVDAKAIAQTGSDMHNNHWLQPIFPSYGDYKMPVYIWLVAIFKYLGFAGEYAVRLPNAIAGLLTIAVGSAIAYILSKEVFKNKNLSIFASLITALVISFSPWSFLFSRTGFEGFLSQFFLSTSILALILSKKYGIKFLILSILMAVIATYTYFSTRFVWLPVFTIFSIYSWYQLDSKLNTKIIIKKISKWSLVLVIYILALIPLFQSTHYNASQEYRYSTPSVLDQHQQVLASNEFRELAGNTTFDRLFFHRHYLSFRQLLANMGDHLTLDYLFISGDSNLRHSTTKHGLFAWWVLPLILAGFYRMLKGNGLVIGVVFSWWLFALIPASIPHETPHALRSLNALVPISILAGFGGAHLYRILKSFQKDSYFYLSFTVASIIIISSFYSFAHHYFTHYAQDSAQAWQGGYKEFVLSEIKMNQNQADTEDEICIYHPDGKIYLWLMAYGPYDGSEFSSWVSQDYQFKKIEQYNFDCQKL